MSNMDNTNNIERLIKLERERYERLLHLVETKKTDDAFANNLGILVRLMPSEYKAYIDLYSSSFSIKNIILMMKYMLMIMRLVLIEMKKLAALLF